MTNIYKVKKVVECWVEVEADSEVEAREKCPLIGEVTSEDILMYLAYDDGSSFPVYALPSFPYYEHSISDVEVVDVELVAENKTLDEYLETFRKDNDAY